MESLNAGIASNTLSRADDRTLPVLLAPIVTGGLVTCPISRRPGSCAAAPAWFRVDRGHRFGPARALRLGRFGPLEQPPPLLGRGGQGTPGLLGLELRLTHSDGGGFLRRIALRAGRCDIGRRGSPICFRRLAHGFRCFLCLFGRQLGGGAGGIRCGCAAFDFGDGLPGLG